MTDAALFWHPRRLLLTLLEDADCTLACAQTLALARAFEAEVTGILVEETSIHELAALTVCTHVGAVTGRFQQLDATRLAAQAERRAALLRQQVEALEAELGRRVAFRVLQGGAVDSLREAKPHDLIFYTGSFSRLEDPEQVAALLEAARQSSGLLLQPPRQQWQEGPVIALYRTAEVAERLLPVLQRLSGAAEIEQHLVGDTSEALTLGSLLATQRHARLLVVELDDRQADEKWYRALRQGMRRLNCPLLLINPHQQ